MKKKEKKAHDRYKRAMKTSGTDFAKALKLINLALKTIPENTDFLELRGDILRNLGRLEESCDDFINVLKENKADKNVLRKLGDVYVKRRMFDEAMNQFGRIIGEGVELGNEEEDEGEESEPESDDDSEDDSDDSDISGEDNEESYMDEVRRMYQKCREIIESSDTFQNRVCEKIMRMTENFRPHLSNLHQFSTQIEKYIEEKRNESLKKKKKVSKGSISISKLHEDADSPTTTTPEDSMFRNVRFFTKEKLEKMNNEMGRNIRILVCGPTNSGKSTLLNHLLGTDSLPTSVNPCTSSIINLHYCETKAEEKVLCSVKVEPKSLTLDECKEVGVCTYAYTGSTPREQPEIDFYRCDVCKVKLMCHFCAGVCHKDHNPVKIVPEPTIVEEEEESEDARRRKQRVCQCFTHKVKGQSCHFERESCYEMKEFQLGESDGEDSWKKFVSKDRASESSLVVERADLHLHIPILKYIKFVDVPGFGEDRPEIKTLIDNSLFANENDAVIFVFNGANHIDESWKRFLEGHRDNLRKYSQRIMFVGTRLHSYYKDLEHLEPEVRNDFKMKCFEGGYDKFLLQFVELKSQDLNEVSKILDYQHRFSLLKKKVHGFAMEGYYDVYMNILARYECELCGLKSFLTDMRDLSNMDKNERNDHFKREASRIKEMFAANRELKKARKEDMKKWVAIAREEIKEFSRKKSTYIDILEFADYSSERIVSNMDKDLREDQDRFFRKAYTYFTEKFVKVFFSKYRTEILQSVKGFYFDSLGFGSSNFRAEYLEDYNIYSRMWTGLMIDYVELTEGDLTPTESLAFIIGGLLMLGGFGLWLPSILVDMGWSFLSSGKMNTSERLADHFVTKFLGNTKKRSSEVLKPLSDRWDSLIQYKEELYDMARWFHEFKKNHFTSYYRFTSHSEFEKFFRQSERMLGTFYASPVLEYLVQRFGTRLEDVVLDTTPNGVLHKVDSSGVIVQKCHLRNTPDCLLTYKRLPHGNRESTIIRESFLAARLNHMNLLSLEGFRWEDKFGYLYTKLYDSSLTKMLVRFDAREFGLSERVKIVDGIVSGMCFLHSERVRIAHRDLKPCNVFVSFDTGEDGSIRASNVLIGDYGTAKLNSDVTTTIAGTRAYAAPEVLKVIRDEQVQRLRKERRIKYSPGAVDVYSFGILLFELLSGVKAIVESDYDQFVPSFDRITSWCDEPEGGKLVSLIQSCLRFNTVKSLRKRQDDQGNVEVRLSFPQFREEWNGLKKDLLIHSESFSSKVKRMVIQ